MITPLLPLSGGNSLPGTSQSFDRGYQMQKDYILVDLRQRKTETQFIEDYWTDLWNDRSIDRTQVTNRIEQLEEFKLLSAHLDLLPPGATVIDGGCGTGDWVMYLAKRGFRSLGLDISNSTINRLKKISPEASWRRCDIRRLPLRTASAHLYISWGVFEHFEEGQRRCLSEALRVLRPGGILALSVPFCNFRHLLALHRSGVPIEEGKALRFYQWRLTRSELERELIGAGFCNVQINPIHQREGISRLLTHAGFGGLPRMAQRLAIGILQRLLPKSFAAHMIFALARKPFV